MKGKIYKYPFIEDLENFYIQIPEDHIILDIQIQNNVICLWAIVNKESSIINLYFHVYGTGFDIYNENLTHIKTIQHGIFVWHIFLKDYKLI